MIQRGKTGRPAKAGGRAAAIAETVETVEIAGTGATAVTAADRAAAATGDLAAKGRPKSTSRS